MEEKDRIILMLEELLPICDSWIQEKNGNLFFIDPNDGEEISAHYGATHIAATLILYGQQNDNQQMYQKGVTLLNSILDRWSHSKTLPAFHFDFNNFALCVIADSIKDDDADLYHRIQQIVKQTVDSSHNTTNWLPMRWFVNMRRYEWSGDKKYDKICQQCRKYIKKATNADGGIEDRLPKGLSFNLQYDVATVGALQFLRNRGVEYDLSKELVFLLNAVAPDGDINYQGRGVNQIFGWSLWVYLLSSSGEKEALNMALNYLEPKVKIMFKNHNLMLNEYDGKEKYLWWDYHYCSVYCAHFLFWLVLSIQDFEKEKIEKCKGNLPCDTGLLIHRTADVFIATFDGRKEYLSERGPLVCALWTKKNGMVFKGAFGPWLGAFGNQHSNETILRNFCGLIIKKSFISCSPHSLMGKICHYLGVSFQVRLDHQFCPIKAEHEIDTTNFLFYCKHEEDAIFNMPILNTTEGTPIIDLLVDGRNVNLTAVSEMRNQYGRYRLYQSKLIRGHVWSLTIR